MTLAIALFWPHLFLHALAPLIAAATVITDVVATVYVTQLIHDKG